MTFSLTQRHQGETPEGGGEVESGEVKLLELGNSENETLR